MPKSEHHNNGQKPTAHGSDDEMDRLYSSIEAWHIEPDSEEDEVPPQVSPNNQAGPAGPQPESETEQAAREEEADVEPGGVEMQEDDLYEGEEGGARPYEDDALLAAHNAAMQPLNEAAQRAEDAIALWRANIRELGNQLARYAVDEHYQFRHDTLTLARQSHAEAEEGMVALGQKLVNLNNLINQGQIGLEEALSHIADLMQQYIGICASVEEYRAWLVPALVQEQPAHGDRDYEDESKDDMPQKNLGHQGRAGAQHAYETGQARENLAAAFELAKSAEERVTCNIGQWHLEINRQQRLDIVWLYENVMLSSVPIAIDLARLKRALNQGQIEDPAEFAQNIQDLIQRCNALDTMVAEYRAWLVPDDPALQAHHAAAAELVLEAARLPEVEQLPEEDGDATVCEVVAHGSNTTAGECEIPPHQGAPSD